MERAALCGSKIANRTLWDRKRKVCLVVVVMLAVGWRYRNMYEGRGNKRQQYEKEQFSGSSQAIQQVSPVAWCSTAKKGPTVRKHSPPPPPTSRQCRDRCEPVLINILIRYRFRMRSSVFFILLVFPFFTFWFAGRRTHKILATRAQWAFYLISARRTAHYEMGIEIEWRGQKN